MIELSPYHQIELAPAWEALRDNPPDRDQVIRTLSRKMLNDQPLIQGDLVYAGRDTKAEFPLAEKYPVHFRKTYYPGAFHKPPQQEFDHHLQISQILDVPAPIGATKKVFRSCLIPGIPLNKLCPFGVEPLEHNIALAEEQNTTSLMGLWHLLETLDQQISKLHAAGLAHGDLFFHNVIVPSSPIGVFLIDFELAVEKNKVSEEIWQKACQSDLEELQRNAVYLQCVLGKQTGPLAEKSLSRLDTLFTNTASRFQKAVDRHSFL
ncbi:MAG: lipopolysaccharide kinase InaA family protein [Verrucomicrobiota bacterium]